MARQLLSEAEGYELLKGAGIPVPRFIIAHTAGEAKNAADEISYPVVMKVISQQVVHKTDAGGVATGIRTPVEATTAFEKITEDVKAHIPGAVIDGIIVEQQLPPGLELIIGGKTDPTFGKVITIGAGGTLVELLRDVSIRVLPVDESEIRTMVRELRSYRLIQGYRNQPPRDEQAFVYGILAAARLVF